MQGLKKSMSEETPFLLTPFKWGAKKLFGEKKVNDAVWKYLQSPIIKADVALGEQAHKLTKKISGGTGSLFLDSKLLPMGSKSTKGGKTGRVEVDIPSITAPVTSVGRFVMPLLGATKAEEMLRGDHKMNNPVITKADLQKTAAMLESLKGQKNEYEKKAQATKLLFKQAELGQIIFPKTHNEFQEKVAELMQKDLKVVEEAIKMAAASEELSNTFGSLNPYGGEPSKGGSAQEAFQRSLME